MNDPIVFSAFIALLVLIVFGAYQCGFSHGLELGFKRGQRSANNFARMKRSEETPRHNGNGTI
jgi:hypothetical protein